MRLGLLFGLFLLVAGVSIVLEYTTGIRFPFVRVFFGVVLTYAGLGLILGAWGIHLPGTRIHEPNLVVFGDETLQVAGTAHQDYNAVFGRALVDLTRIPADVPARIEVNAIFGNADVVYDPARPMQIRGTAAFGSTRLPDGTHLSFGERLVSLPGEPDGGEPIALTTNAVFGAVTVSPGPERVGTLLEAPAR